MILAIYLENVVASLPIPPVEENSGVKLPPSISLTLCRMHVVFLVCGSCIRVGGWYVGNLTR